MISDQIFLFCVLALVLLIPGLVLYDNISGRSDRRCETDFYRPVVSGKMSVDDVPIRCITHMKEVNHRIYECSRDWKEEFMSDTDNVPDECVRHLTSLRYEGML